jgi:hypothetical protein
VQSHPGCSTVFGNGDQRQPLGGMTPARSRGWIGQSRPKRGQLVLEAFAIGLVWIPILLVVLHRRARVLMARVHLPDDALPGSLSLSRQRSGKPSCHCANGDGHPFGTLTFMAGGKKRVETIPAVISPWFVLGSRRAAISRKPPPNCCRSTPRYCCSPANSVLAHPAVPLYHSP